MHPASAAGSLCAAPLPRVLPLTAPTTAVPARAWWLPCCARRSSSWAGCVRRWWAAQPPCNQHPSGTQLTQQRRARSRTCLVLPQAEHSGQQGAWQTAAWPAASPRCGGQEHWRLQQSAKQRSSVSCSPGVVSSAGAGSSRGRVWAATGGGRMLGLVGASAGWSLVLLAATWPSRRQAAGVCAMVICCTWVHLLVRWGGISSVQAQNDTGANHMHWRPGMCTL